jgi:hypothetical protein
MDLPWNTLWFALPILLAGCIAVIRLCHGLKANGRAPRPAEPVRVVHGASAENLAPAGQSEPERRANGEPATRRVRGSRDIAVAEIDGH